MAARFLTIAPDNTPEKMNAAMAAPRGIWINMRTPSRPRSIAAQARPDAKIVTNAMPRRPPFQRNGTSGLGRPNARTPQDPRMKYEHYLALAGAETQAGDLIAAENYYQHAEHYLRSMRERAN
ncbi:MAG: DUF4167 domain-containing protein [Bradyrhizobium sp.]|nr:DUF4167 domain-containing protein [Bradyrhizobium sp.]